MEIYQPKGSMCTNCVHKNSKCSHLDFSKMKVIAVVEHGGDLLKIVRCTEFKRESNDHHR
jgi:hypothetical protein